MAQVYAVGCALAPAASGVVLGLSTIFRSRLGLWLSIAMIVAPPIFFFVGLANQLAN